MGGKTGAGGRSVREINVWNSFSWREFWARLDAVRVRLVRVREGLAHLSHTESSKGQEPRFSMGYWHGAIVRVCSLPSAKWRVTLVLPSLIKQHSEKNSVLTPQDASALDFFVSYPAHSITAIGKNTVPGLDSVMSSTSLHLWPLISVWLTRVQTSSHWETLVLKASGKFIWPHKEFLSSKASSPAECRS